MRKLLFLLCCNIVYCSAAAQDAAAVNAIKHQLHTMLERDQKARTGADSAQYMHYIDSTNLVQAIALIGKYGWLGKSVVGEEANQALFLMIQHSDSATQVKYLPLLIQSVHDSESRPADLAMLQDRVLMRQGKKQIYGSQVTMNKTTGAPEFWPIEDEPNVNIRRSKVGLPPLEVYAEYFGFHYTVPVGK